MSVNVGREGSKQRKSWLSVYLQDARKRRKSTNDPSPPQPLNLWSLGDAIADGSLSGSYSAIAIEDPSKLEDGASYRVEFDYDITFGSIQLLVGNTGPISTVGSGKTIIEVEADTADFFRVRQTTANTIGSLTNISVTKV